MFLAPNTIMMDNYGVCVTIFRMPWVLLILPESSVSAIIYPLWKVGDKMLNYANLNDMEFEALCKDIMERKLGVSLRRFGPGRDHGVDLTDDVSTKSIVVQVKHYRNSTTEQLVRSLKNELPKVTELALQQYYICCSRELSADNINALYQHFQAYMASDRHIVTLIEIDDFLKKEANKDILKKHFKLWLDSTGILGELFNDDIFVDCEALLSDVDELQKLFVRTSVFDKALKVLEHNQPLCIIGDPGAGKSITSKMLVLHYAAQGYRVRYTTDVSDLKYLKKALRDDASAKEVILLDDCFGQAYFEMKASQSTELVALIKYIKLHPSKVLILNSRVTIFQEARERQQDLVRSLEREEFHVQFLNMNELTNVEKAKILYNHLTFSGIPDDFFTEIQKYQRYLRIIYHPNYNPRIIEFVCSPSLHHSISANQFFRYFLDQLDRPQKMWKNEYEDHLKPADRILLQTIYSLSKTTVSAELVRLCFERRIISLSEIDKTIDQYSRSLKRLNKSFIKILDNRGNCELAMQNPSVNDYLDTRLLGNTPERKTLIASICNDKQLLLFPEKERLPYAIHLLKSGGIDSFVFTNPHYRSRFIALTLLAAELYLSHYSNDLYDFFAFQDNGKYWFAIPDDVVREITEAMQKPSLWEYYHLSEFFEKSNRLSTFLEHIPLDDAGKIICIADTFYPKSAHSAFVQQIQNYLDKAIPEFCDVEASQYEEHLDYSAAIERATTSIFMNEYEDDSDAYTVITEPDAYLDISEVVAILEDEIIARVCDHLSDILWNLPLRFSHYYNYYFTHNNYSDFITVNGMESLINHHVIHIENDDYDSNDNDDGYSPIDAIFER